MQAAITPYEGYLAHDDDTRAAHMQEIEAAERALAQRQATVSHGAVFFDWLQGVRALHSRETASPDGTMPREVEAIEHREAPGAHSLPSLRELSRLSVAELAQVSPFERLQAVGGMHSSC